MWIEINGNQSIAGTLTVTLHTEGVDWNINYSPAVNAFVLTVTLHTEGVDWNYAKDIAKKQKAVTLHTEGVDWNLCT